jgi:hypothetical protein
MHNRSEKGQCLGYLVRYHPVTVTVFNKPTFMFGKLAENRLFYCETKDIKVSINECRLMKSPVCVCVLCPCFTPRNFWTGGFS